MIIMDCNNLAMVNFGEGSAIALRKGPLEQLPLAIEFINGQSEQEGVLIGQYATLQEVMEIITEIANKYLAGEKFYQVPLGKYKSIKEAQEDAKNESNQNGPD